MRSVRRRVIHFRGLPVLVLPAVSHDQRWTRESKGQFADIPPGGHAFWASARYRGRKAQGITPLTYLVWELAAGAVAGSLIGHFWAGMSRSDLKEIGDTLQASTASLIVIGRSRLMEALASATKHAVKQFEKEMSTDLKAFNKALKTAINESVKAA